MYIQRNELLSRFNRWRVWCIAVGVCWSACLLAAGAIEEGDGAMGGGMSGEGYA